MQGLVQLALDFWSGGQGAEENRPPGPDQQAQEAPKKGAKQPSAKPLADLLTPAVFRHPAANREVLLGEARVAYLLSRSRRRTIGFTVGPDGLAVRAPAWVTLAGVDAALRDKGAWILRKLGEQQARAQRQENARIQWGDGAVLPYLGEPLSVVLDPAHRFAGRGGVLVETARGGRELHIALPHTAAPAQVRDAVQAWLMREARQRFTERLEHFAPLLGVRWTRLRLSSAQTRWGSARADGAICLNWRLMHYRQPVIDYVVVHELSHLRVMDHSPRFWDTVGSVMPDYAQLRAHLREQPAPPWE